MYCLFFEKCGWFDDVRFVGVCEGIVCDVLSYWFLDITIIIFQIATSLII